MSFLRSFQKLIIKENSKKVIDKAIADGSRNKPTKKENKLAITIKYFLGYLSANIPVIGSNGAKVKLLTARTPAIAKGESSDASPANKNIARTVNQSPM